MKRIRVLSLIAVLVFAAVCAHAQAGSDGYSMGLAAAKIGSYDFSYIHFQSFLKENPRSRCAQGALFAVSEYSFWKNNYYDAKKSLIRFIKKYPDAKERIFALAYLLKLSQDLQDESVAAMLQKEILNKRQMVFLFKSSKEYSYRSLFRKRYKVIYYIDRVEFYVNGKLLTKVSY